MTRDREHASPTDELLGRLPREVAPGTDLWPAIEAGIVAAERGDDDALLLTTLPRAVAPPADLWPRIAADIANDSGPRPALRARRSKLPVRLAASVAVAVIVGAVLLRAGLFGGIDDSELESGPATDSPEIANAAIEAWLSPLLLDPDAAAPAALSAAFEDARQTFFDQIAAVRTEREAIEASLALYPDQPTLLAAWRHTYEAELLLIDAAGRVLTDIQTGWRS